MKNIRIIENEKDWMEILKEFANFDLVYNIKRKFFLVAVGTTEDDLLIMNRKTIKEIEDEHCLRFDFILGYDENVSINKNVLVNINTASFEELKSVDGIWESKAKLIIEKRPYTDKFELLGKKIIGVRAFEKVKEYVTV